MTPQTYPHVAADQHAPGLVLAPVLAEQLDGLQERLDFTRLLLLEVWRKRSRVQDRSVGSFISLRDLHHLQVPEVLGRACHHGNRRKLVNLQL